MSRAKHRLNICGATVAEPHPDHLRRVSALEAPLTEVIILRDDREPVRTRVLPNALVVRRLQPERTHVRRARIHLRQRGHEARREVVVEQELQGRRPARSGWISDEAPLAVGGEGEHGADVFTLKVREVG